MTDQMPQLIGLLICEKMDRKSMDINKIFDTINTDTFPCTGPFVIFMRFSSGVGSYGVVIKIEGPSGKLASYITESADKKNMTELTAIGSKFAMEKDKMHDVIIDLTGRIAFTAEGVYKVKAYIQPDTGDQNADRLVGEHLLIINKI